jgi:hypothetical protein
VFRKKILINIILIVITIVLGVKSYQIWTGPLNVPSAQARQKTSGEKAPEAAPAEEEDRKSVV